MLRTFYWSFQISPKNAQKNLSLTVVYLSSFMFCNDHPIEKFYYRWYFITEYRYPADIQYLNDFRVNGHSEPVVRKTFDTL